MGGGGGGGVKTRALAVLIKILFELNPLVELQTVVRIRILFNTGLEEGL